MRRSLLVIVMLLLLQHNSFSQATKAFTEDPVKFLEELTDFFESSDKKAGREFMTQFTVIWNSKLTDDQRKTVYRISNTMLKKRMKAFPDFKNYLGSVMSFATTNQTDKSFQAWQETIDKILKSKTSKHYTDFLEMSDNLFTTNSFYKSASTEWRSSNNNYSFEYDSVPKIIFSSMDLKCYAKGDSAIIFNTKGVYYPTSGVFYGQGGKVTWERAGIEENVSHAELKRFTITVKSSEYKADSVVYYNKKYFDKPLIGELHEKVMADRTGDKATYPRFDSYLKTFELKNLAEGVDYSGGITIIGARLQGSGSDDQDAKLTFRRNGKIFLVASSKSYSIRPEKITTERASIVIYYENDSIYHPGLLLKFFVQEKELMLYRDEKGIAKSPYFNSYHNIDMYFEAMYWKIDEPKIDMKMLIGSTNSKANFESSNYFREMRWAKIQGIDEQHPLVRIRDYAKSINSNTFQALDLARFIKLPPDQVYVMLLNLATGGFLIYDIEDGRVTLKERLFTYIKAKAGRSDYDVIDFNSNISKEPNASLNLLNFDMTIRGCGQIFLSDSQNVVVYPKNQEITLKKNRNFTFDGRVNAGKFEYFGKEFSFEYDLFKLNLVNIDSMRIKVRSRQKDENGEYPYVRVKNVIEDLTGELLIDKMNNKSSVQRHPEYPIFNSKKDAFVYYDKRSIQKGVYGRDKFYFHLTPFSFDSLNTFDNEGLAFDGTFTSAGILPDFQEKLTLQEDYSLGFIRNTPAGGFPLYGGKGNFTDKIKLSNEGLRGDGVLKYVTSTSKSTNFIFYPDSMNASVQDYEIAKQSGKIEFPPVKATDVYTHWVPKKDVMMTSKVEKALIFFNGQSEMNGTVYLEPGGLTGKGRMDFAKAELESDLMKFKEKSFNADTADFRLQAVDLSALAFSTDNVNANIDFESRTGDFKSNGGGSFVKFPINQYICFMDKFKWFMDKGDIELSAEGKKVQSPAEQGDVDLTGSEFISTHPEQDSLRFFSPKAKYDTKNHIIYAREVKQIDVADARVFPDSGNVIIHKKARMETLNNARILANTVTKYHNIYNATVNVYARKSYSGAGDYNYVDELKRDQRIHFVNLAVDTTGQTFAEGDIPDTSNFMLSPNFAYRGKVRLNASSEFLTFNGAVQIDHNCEKLGKNFLKFTAEVNPTDIFIPVNPPLVDINNDKISAGVILTNDSTHIYSTFLSKRELYSDQDVLTSAGFLYFDKKSSEYKIASKEKIREMALPGNYLSFHKNKCEVYGEGKLNLGGNLGQIKMNTVGNVTHSMVTDTVYFDAMMALDFFFDEGLIKSMAETIEKAEGLQPVSFGRPTYEKGLRELLGKEEADKLISQVNLYGSFKKFPGDLEHTLFLSDIKLSWNTRTKSYWSEGPIGIGNIYKTQLNKFVNGRIELVKKRSGDVLNIYLQVNDNTWYFFNYQTGLMQAISSDEKFNTVIKELKPDKRKAETDKGESSYQFILSTARKKADFLKKFDTDNE